MTDCGVFVEVFGEARLWAYGRNGTRTFDLWLIAGMHTAKLTGHSTRGNVANLINAGGQGRKVTGLIKD